MNRWVRWTVVILVCAACCIGLADFLLERSARRAATENGTLRDFHEVTAKELDQDVRNRVPLGSPRTFIEDFLRKEGMRFSFDPSSRTILAKAPYLKESNFLIEESLGFTFRLDDAGKLKSIDSSTHLTGP